LSLNKCIDKTGARLEEQLSMTNSLIRGQPQLIKTNNCSSIDDLIHAMGAMNLFTSNAMGATDDNTQQRAKRIVYTPGWQLTKKFHTCFVCNVSIIWDTQHLCPTATCN
jgi:hypothetical protein